MKKIISVPLRILRWFWLVLTTGTSLIVNLTLLFLFLFVISLFVEHPVKVPNGAALIIAPKGEIVEKTTAMNPISRFIDGSAGIPIPEETLLQDILDAINTAAKDNRIQAIVLSLSKLDSAGLNQLQAIGHSLEKFRKSGKKVIAVDDQYNQGQYYLASFADKILLNPMGGVYLRGFGVFRLYIKDLLDKLAINFHVFKVGSFKSAVEPFIRTGMSNEAREANKLWLGNLWSTFCKDIAKNRGFTPGFIDSFINNMPGYLRKAEGSNSKMALEAGLVDELKTRPEINDYLVGLVGSSNNGRSFKQIDSSDYLETITPSFTSPAKGKDRIGLIVARGNIVYGEGIPGQISSDTLCQRIRQAMEDDSIKAVVLRVDSGGGSAFASELIRQELLLLQESGKPLVVSMGSMAASGAYWISAGADKIYASPFTLTGSIGIFGIFPTFENTITKIGVTSDGTGTTKLAGSGNPSLPLSPELSQTMQLGIEEGYSRFINLVAKGRHMPPAKVESIAEGRVWDGTKARELGLVDAMGSLDDAIAGAAKLAGLKQYTTVYVRENEPPGSELLQKLSNLSGRVSESFRPRIIQKVPILQGLQDQFGFLLSSRDPANIYAYCLMPRPAPIF